MLPKIDFNTLKIYQDGAVLSDMVTAAADPMVSGFTTNPTLMAKAGITDYAGFGKDVIAAIPEKPISFEVFSDEFEEMRREAHIIQTWGGNIFTKIPIMNTKGESSLSLIKELSGQGMALNVTAIFTWEQIESVSNAISPGKPAIISVFAGRIACPSSDELGRMSGFRIGEPVIVC